jgi:hypothetical protein
MCVKHGCFDSPSLSLNTSFSQNKFFIHKLGLILYKIQHCLHRVNNTPKVQQRSLPLWNGNFNDFFC